MSVQAEDKVIALTVKWTQNEAWAFAEFLKRSGFSDYESLAQSKDEAYLMRDAGEKLRQSISEAGYAPR